MRARTRPGTRDEFSIGRTARTNRRRFLLGQEAAVGLWSFLVDQ
jgi:hypothetical protein